MTVKLELENDEVRELYNEYSDYFQCFTSTWAWFDVHERIWEKLKTAMDEINED